LLPKHRGLFNENEKFKVTLKEANEVGKATIHSKEAQN